MLGSLKRAVKDGIIDAKYVEDENYKPTHILDIYKNRRGRYKNIRIWTKLDLGTGQRQDIFLTTSDNEPISEPIDIFTSIHEELINYREYFERN